MLTPPLLSASYYAAHAKVLKVYPPLTGRVDAEVAIVGGGYAGLATALGLAERGVQGVVLLEAEHIGFGASGRNAGFVFSGYSLSEAAMIAKLGVGRARALYLATGHAIQLIRRRIHEYQIDCDAVDGGLIWANWFKDLSILRRHQQLLQEQFGVIREWLDEETLRDRVHSARYHGGLFESDALHLDPLAYARGLARAAVEKGVAVFEHSRVLRLERDGGGFRVHSTAGHVQARQVLLATGGYLAGLNRTVDRAVLPIATYAMSTEPLGMRLGECLTTSAAVYDTRFAFDYYRPLPDTSLLWGGRISIRERAPEEIRRLLYRDMLQVFPQLEGVRVEYGWSGLMSYARHEMPQIGTDGHGLWWAQAFGGHGLTPTSVAGELVAAGIATGDDAWRQFADFGLVSAFRPWSYPIAQLRYAWRGYKDRRHTRKRG